jgi:polyisoprenoid-binding protein YceI
MLIAALAVALIGAPVFAAEAKLSGENTKIEFVGTKTDGKHEGGFKTVTGTASAEKISVEIDCDSLYSDDAKLTAHLKSPDFFNVKENPKAKFVSTKIAKSDKGYTVTGDLTLNGKTKSIEFPATIDTSKGFKLTAEFKINKEDFGMAYGKGKINNEVSLKVSVDAK